MTTPIVCSGASTEGIGTAVPIVGVTAISPVFISMAPWVRVVAIDAAAASPPPAIANAATRRTRFLRTPTGQSAVSTVPSLRWCIRAQSFPSLSTRSASASARVIAERL